MALRKGLSLWFGFFSFALILFWGTSVQGQGSPNYREALAKSILFFQGQRSGRLPRGQEITWRSNSGISDGFLAHVDLSGGYYDAGDNVKFNFPMAFTTTMLSWGTLEYGKKMGSELGNARAAIRWATDYLLKCATATPGKLYVGVGDPNVDHKCWERPEDMDTVRSVYSVSPSNPGSDVAGETAAALAAASMVFRKVDPKYSRLLLRTAQNVMEFAMQYRGAYSDSLGSAVCPFYCSYSGYKVDYILGVNPLKMSYMVGFGANYPKRIHHRGSSVPSLAAHPQSFGCDGGFQPFFYTANPNPNLLTGAIVGGPNQNDGYSDDRTDYSHSEPATYINAAIVGPLASLAGSNTI
ncbi:hypothetical protein TEA_008831 [Camellia sinensis var. sinensis]|uniref:Endoglucanase n=1 Tax=Camellia sinensis var. sinensis TaxID=542762 RepID=A0A4S4E134_CAMSN|nr:hypothetical protein TEA_008831 [Camellia sinensis var. sinensis]